MKKKRALWALEVMGEIDPAILAETETVRARPRWRVAVIVAAALVVVGVVGGVALSRRDGGERPPTETTGTGEPAPTLSGEIYDGYDAAYQQMHVRWAGVFYAQSNDGEENIVPGVELGKVHENNLHIASEPRTIPEDYDPYLTASTTIPPGNAIYACEGYSAAWRICGYDKAGRLRLFECKQNAQLSNNRTPLRYVFPDAGQIETVFITEANTGSIGEIDDRADIEYIVKRLHDDGRFIPHDQYAAARAENDTSLSLRFMLIDGTKITLSLVGDAVGYWLAPISLPGGIMKTVRDNIIYPASDNFHLDSKSYGTTRNDNIGLLGEYHETHGSFAVELVGHGLILSRVAGQMEVKIADDAAGDIRVEGLDIYYRRTDGKIARIRYDCPGDYAMDEKFKRGEDMTAYITAREIVDEGPYVRLQTQGGQFFTLDAEGNLALNGEIIAQNVLHYMLDAWGVIYQTPDGLYRRLTADGQTITLCTDPLLQFSRHGLYIHYLTEGGRLSRVRCDGERTETLWLLDGAVKYFCHSVLNDAYFVLDEGGTAWVIFNGIRYHLADEIEDMGWNYGGIVLTYRNGHVETRYFGMHGRYLYEGPGVRLRGGVELS